MKRREFTLAAAVAALPGLLSTTARAQQGKGYVELAQRAPVDTKAGEIEVIEFFSYGCPHCADLEPHMQAWIRRLPPDVQFRRIPVAFQPAWENLGRVYYTLDALGEEAKLSPEVFVAIHGSAHLNLAQEQKFFDWAASKGLDRRKVEDTYKSFGVAGKMGRAKQAAQAYGIQSVPTLIVDGKFLVSSSTAGSHERVPGALDAAIAVARAERPK